MYCPWKPSSDSSSSSSSSIICQIDSTSLLINLTLWKWHPHPAVCGRKFSPQTIVKQLLHFLTIRPLPLFDISYPPPTQHTHNQKGTRWIYVDPMQLLNFTSLAFCVCVSSTIRWQKFIWQAWRRGRIIGSIFPHKNAPQHPVLRNRLPFMAWAAFLSTHPHKVRTQRVHPPDNTNMGR